MPPPATKPASPAPAATAVSAAAAAAAGATLQGEGGKEALDLRRGAAVRVGLAAVAGGGPLEHGGLQRGVTARRPACSQLLRSMLGQFRR
jgi:hypothetical protein